MSKKIVLTGAIFITLAIIFGAMAAHALEKWIGPDLITTFEKGVKYQFYVGLGLLAFGLNADKINFSLKLFYLLNLIGVILFSGGIYTYVFHELAPALKPAVHIVPFGGSCMIIGWIVIIIQLIRHK